jgi:predicted DNA-binding transcriptional regulator AlpA
MHDIADPILTEEEYRAWVKLSAPTAQRQRSDGSGPPFVQLSERRIGYRKSAVERWLETRTISRVGALVAAEHPSQPAAAQTDDAKAAVPSEPASRRQERGAAA